MSKTNRRVLIAALLLLLASAALPGDGAAAEPYPIWWSPKLELDSLNAIDARLARPFWDPSEYAGGLPLYPEGERQEDMREARNCADLLALREHGFEAGPYRDFKLMLSLESWCRAIVALKTAKPAERSFVQGFRFDRSSLGILPAMALLSVSCEGICWQHAANQRGISLGDVDPDMRITSVDDFQIELESPGIEQDSLEIVGRADFDGNGLEDLLIIYDTSSIGGTYGATQDLLLTRDAPDTVLTVINGDQYLCPDYKCEPSESDPPALYKAD